MIQRALFLSLWLISCNSLLADDKNPTWTDPAKAAAEDPDFAIQGEYTGELKGKKVGLHLIAQGAGKFAVVLYPGGLPGEGFSGDKATRVKGKIEGGKIELAGYDGAFSSKIIPLTTGEMKAAQLIFLGDQTLRKVERVSPTMGAKPPAEALVLFDGKNTSFFENGKLDGETLVQGITSIQKWRNFSLHVEFKIPYMPAARGQGRGNSGCYLQGRYEVQMLDSFGLEGENNECGGIYTIKTPDVNMALPPLSWQTYDIDYTAATFDASGKKIANAKATVKHNGVLIHKDVELTHATTAAPLKEGPEPGPLHFQDHGTPVRYRNIWLVEK